MKTPLSQVGAAVVIGAFVSLAPFAQAQMSTTSETTTTTESSGTVSEFSPNTVILKTETSAEPVRYSYSKTTTVVDDAGQPVDISVIKTGVPVQVIYVKDADGMTAQKIIVRKQVTTTAPAAPVIVEKHESTTTTTETH